MTTSFIAEVSSNHNQDLDRCFAFIETAAKIGCRAVKFQLFRIDQLFAPEILARSPEHQKRKDWELPLEYLPSLHDKCRANGIQFSCTPFYLDAVEALAPFVRFYKIASYELLWKELLTACAETGKPVVLSTGMATMEEIGGAVETLRQAGCRELTLLHCVSAYPTPIDQCNLAVMQTLRKRFDCPVGWSDHSVSPAVLYRAVHRWQAEVVEFHLDLDGLGEEYRIGHCWLPEQIARVMQEVHSGFLADGSGEKRTVTSEAADRMWRTDPEDGLRPFAALRRTT